MQWKTPIYDVGGNDRVTTVAQVLNDRALAGRGFPDGVRQRFGREQRQQGAARLSYRSSPRWIAGRDRG